MGFKTSEAADKVIIAIIALILIFVINAIIRTDSNRHGHSQECMAGTDKSIAGIIDKLGD